ncbi:hypothetical protein [Lysinibacillus sp. NPDC093216]|uniref:hypothetical protein n=1 Tax=Lysinibacillus sp. NPDC093216 TaxID=3390576 RepID=UPI003D0948B9
MIIIKFFKKYPIMIFLTIFSIPILISIFMYLPWFSYSKGNVDGWLGFWGSYLGGTIGTLGVIATTYFIINHETEVAKKSMINEDKRKRDLMYLEIEMKKTEEVIESILDLNRKWVDLHNILVEYAVSKERFIETHTKSDSVRENLYKFNNKRKVFSDQLNRVLLHKNTFHDDLALKIFIKRSIELVEKYIQISSNINACNDIKECINHSDEIENLIEEFDAYDDILKFYSEQYKSIISSINQNEYRKS